MQSVRWVDEESEGRYDDEEYKERYVDEEYEDEPVTNSAGTNSKKRFQSLQASLKSAFDDYCKQFDDKEAELVRAKRDNKELAETNKKLNEELKRAKEREESSKKLKEELKRAKEGEESSKNYLEQTKKKLQKLCTELDQCDELCNQQAAAPQFSNRRKYGLKVGEVNDLWNCPICFQPWTQSGEHNFCSLSCGHFFGRSCITEWISMDGNRNSSTCPVCSSKVSLSDIRHHYVSQIYDGAMKLA